MSKKVIFGKKIDMKGDIIFVKEEDFQSPRHGDESTNITINEINRIKSLSIDEKSIPELLGYYDISLWWFIYRQMFLQLQKTLDFITNFSDFIKNTNPDSIKVVDQFARLDVIEQICRMNKIGIEYSKLNYLKYQKHQQIKQRLKNSAMEIISKRRISKRKKIFYNKEKAIPQVTNSIIFAAAHRFRQETLIIENNKKERGEHLIHHVIRLIDKDEKIIGIDLESDLRKNDMILNERLDSEMPWFPPELLFNDKNKQKKNRFLKNYENLIALEDFHNLFSYKGISLWYQLKNTFEKMGHSPYIPFWIDLIDSLTEFFSNNKPKAVFLPYETGPLALAIIAACRKTNVTTLGIQTGFIHKFHINYSHDRFATKEDPYGFPLPDNLLLYGDYTRRLLIKKGYPEKVLVVLGNPVFFNLDKIQDYLKNKFLFEKYKIDKTKKVILFTTSGLQELQEHNIKHNYDSQTWRYILENFSDNKNFFIILKPHPLENPLNYNKIVNEYNASNARVIQGDLFELIYLSSVVISIFSTTMFDSLCMKKPVIQIKFGDAYSSPLDEYEQVVIQTDLKHLTENILKVLQNNESKEKLLKNCLSAIKDFYNIPEKNPESILKELLND